MPAHETKGPTKAPSILDHLKLMMARGTKLTLRYLLPNVCIQAHAKLASPLVKTTSPESLIPPVEQEKKPAAPSGSESSLGPSNGRIKRQRLLDTTEVLRYVARNKGVLDAELSVEERTAFLNATTHVFCGHPEHRRLHRLSATKRAADRQVLNNTGIRRLRAQPLYATPRPLSLTPSVADAIALNKEGNAEEVPTNAAATECARKCYVCKAKYTSVHHFYDQLCPDNENCAPLNFHKRGELADLSGKVSIALKRR